MNQLVWRLVAETPSPHILYRRAYACHQALMSASGGQPALWVDLAPQGACPDLRVHTQAETNLSQPEGWRIGEPVSLQLDRLSQDDRFRFRLVASPAVKRNGRRYAIWTGSEPGERDRLAKHWLVARVPGLGFSVDEDTLQVREYRNVQLHSTGRSITFATATYKGLLTVIDTTAFVKTLLVGIGPQKSMGCGLLLLKRT